MTDGSIADLLIQTIRNMHWAEGGAVITGIVYVVLAAKENIWCWFFGIISSLLSIYLFLISKLYAESFLYFYYVLAGIYGWYTWRKRSDQVSIPISVWTWKTHLIALVVGIVSALLLAALLRQFTDAVLPVVDSFTTVFSFIATYMVARKVLENWLYWIVIDLVSVGLYGSRELYFYALLMLAYSIIAIWGFNTWKKEYQKQII